MIRNRTAHLLLILSVAFMLQGAPASRAGDVSALPAELDLVPDKALVVLSCRVADLWTNDGAESVRKLAKEDAAVAGMIAQMEMSGGLALADIDRVVVAGWGSLNAPQFIFLLRSTKALDRAKVRAALAPDAVEKQLQGKSYFAGKNGKSVWFATDQTAAVGSTGDIEELLSKAAKKDRPLGHALQQNNRHVVVGVQLATVAKAVEGATPPPLQPVLQAQTGTLTAAVAKKQLALDLQLRFATEAAAEAGEKGVHAAFTIAQQSLPAIIEQVAGQELEGQEKFLHGKLLALLKDTQTALRKPSVQRQGTVVSTRLRIETADPALGLFLMLPRANKADGE